MNIQALFKTAPVTGALVLIFILLYAIQVFSGVDANDPTTRQLIKWGANALPFSMGYEPWRLLTSAFLHIGLMHLLFNGFAMYIFGKIAEPMLGSVKFLLLFLLSAVGGGLLNNWVTFYQLIQDGAMPAVSAGASGGIMGIGAALLVASLFKMSVNGMRLDIRSLMIILVINLVYGFVVPGIDNAGHIGGAITGAIIAAAIGTAYKFSEQINSKQITIANTNNNSSNNRLAFLPWLTMMVLTAIFVGFWYYLHQQTVVLL